MQSLKNPCPPEAATLFLCACESEADAVREALESSAPPTESAAPGDGASGGRHAAVSGGSPRVRVCGIGMVEAALGAQAVLALERPGRVWLVGSCGAYGGSGLSLGAVVVACEVVVVDAGEALGLSERVTAPVRLRPPLPPPEGRPLGGPFSEGPFSGASLSAGFSLAGALPCGAVLGTVATTLGVTVNDDAAASLRRFSRAEVEHLEAFAVGRACASLGVPWGIVLGVANAVGTNARSEWRAHHAQAEKAAARIAVAMDAALRASGTAPTGSQDVNPPRR